MVLATTRLLQRRKRLFLRQMAQKTQDQLRRNPEIGSGPVKCVDYPAQNRIKRNPAPGMRLRIKENFDMAHILRIHLFKIREGQIEKVLPRNQNRHALVIKIEKILQRAEIIRLADRVDGAITQGNSVTLCERKHHFRFERALNVKMQLRFRHCLDKRATVHSEPFSYSSEMRARQPPSRIR